MYAMLADYESDPHGAYTQIVGIAVTDPSVVPDGMTIVRVPAARCLQLPLRGPMPQTLIQAWHHVWRHTDTGTTPTRSFTTDLEIHHPDGADIYLAVN
jgi:predicted transcriptional regulator YdeE